MDVPIQFEVATVSINVWCNITTVSLLATMIVAKLYQRGCPELI